ncbi:sugar transferase [Paenibacillus sp. N3.4]|uniref:sugar transferase n=1 Tax=Paenibacillus sp. N3.4 TaxID=2603222 RepID=UPI0011CC4E0C|nr:sugar transferase [Paenibacillus sp. N3.4]TXK85647.1 sugar transferase [Paenibacillus sp. N3.4]
MYPIIKRIIDFVFSFFAIVILWPIFLIIAILIRIDSKGPVFFRQKRMGRNKKYFYILKFRTMKIDTPKDMPTHILKNPDAFITKVGKFLRKSSMDELPQILNILKGEMSIVGPRPALWNQYDLISARDLLQVNDIRPGLTGWAQINGRDELAISKKVELDGFYYRKMNYMIDIKIFFLTIFSVIATNGVKEGFTEESIK